MEAVLAHIWLREEARLSTRRIREAREHFGGALEACRALNEGDLFFTPREREQKANASWKRAEKVLENCRKAGARAICYEEDGYPEDLRQLYDPPAVLYLKGTMPRWEEMPVLAIVGRRKASPLGLETARRFARVLSAHGFLIVSGLAQGADGAAHQGALEGPTPTVAVLGTAIDQCYPASHNGLLRRILEKEGAVMLSGETAAGLYPVEAVEAMAAIALSTEENINYQNRLREEAPSAVPSVTSSISYATCTTATSLHCAAIIPVSKSGRTARMISRFRPPVPIICCTNSLRSQRRLSLVWGVCPLVVPEADSTDALFAGAVEAAQKAGLVKNGDMVVLTAGLPLGVSGTTNLLKVEVIGDLLLSGTGVTRKCVTGPVVVCKDAQEALKSVSNGDILAVPYTTNEMMPAIRRLSGLITEQGGLDSHAATSALALDIPAVVGAVNATALLKSGSCVTLDAATGTVCAATKEA